MQNHCVVDEGARGFLNIAYQSLNLQMFSEFN
jgi:hypothetical protein